MVKKVLRICLVFIQYTNVTDRQTSRHGTGRAVDGAATAFDIQLHRPEV